MSVSLKESDEKMELMMIILTANNIDLSSKSIGIPSREFLLAGGASVVTGVSWGRQAAAAVAVSVVAVWVEIAVVAGVGRTHPAGHGGGDPVGKRESVGSLVVGFEAGRSVRVEGSLGGLGRVGCVG